MAGSSGRKGVVTGNLLVGNMNGTPRRFWAGNTGCDGRPKNIPR